MAAATYDIGFPYYTTHYTQGMGQFDVYLAIRDGLETQLSEAQHATVIKAVRDAVQALAPAGIEVTVIKNDVTYPAELIPAT